MKSRLHIIVFSFLFIALIKPQNVFAECRDIGDCQMVPPGGCAGGSVACDDGQCVYTWQCNNDGCTSWSNWSPDPCSTGETQTRECLSGITAYQIQLCGGIPVGGSTCNRDYPIVDCPGGFEKSPNILSSQCVTDRQLLCNQPNPSYPAPNTNYAVGSAQSVGGCCAEDDEGGCTSHTLNLHQCVAACPAGTTQQCALTNFGNYQRYNSCFSPNLCDDSNDVYVPPAYSSSAAGLCYCNCDPDGGSKCGRTCAPQDSIYNVVTTCQSMSYSCTCVSSCSATAPTAPTLLSPSNGDTVSTTTNNLTWNLAGQTWGAGCPTNNNNYYLYVGSTADSLALSGSATQASGISSVPITRSAGTYYWQVRASNGSLTTNSPIWSFTITDAEPWWQVKDGDLTTNDDISSNVPSGQLFDIVGLGGFPGVPVYGNTFNLSNDTSKISATAWHANTTTTQSRIFNYAFFDNLIPDDVNFNDVSTLVSGGTSYTDGYEWYTATGDVSTSGDINIGNRKVILFVENGNFNINGRINLNDGVGFFGVFVDGNISIDPAVVGAPSIEGIYLSDGSFSTGAGTSQLHIRGSVATFGIVNLQRDLTVDTTPAELFEFAPDQMLLFPEKLMFRRTKWTEVAP